MTAEAGAERRRWFSRERYGPPSTVAGFAGAFLALFILAGMALIATAPLMSNACTDAAGQTVCPIDGPDWVRPWPGNAIFLGLGVALAGLLIGRPLRTRAVIAGYALVAVGLIAGALVL
ncbi:hypothetical protein KOI35_12575 [Actinoplanes bogorensis]|uniref:Uncharacterized protein n=1 Tax=Paractinoplanes bogorensis TaxID=1610840 RepID=A0ABS5YLJ3_9ACTN|nr:hypothetical protein [Actinoplanes bogorensis]MBU2664330.1 hypothetical protein [Actinoplanes bogorensis]